MFGQPCLHGKFSKYLNFFRLQTLLPLGSSKAHFLPLSETFKTSPLDGFEMHKNIRATIICRDKPKAFRIIEPFDRTIFSI